MPNSNIFNFNKRKADELTKQFGGEVPAVIPDEYESVEKPMMPEYDPIALQKKIMQEAAMMRMKRAAEEQPQEIEEYSAIDEENAKKFNKLKGIFSGY